jgi:hypothetical protein
VTGSRVHAPTLRMGIALFFALAAGLVGAAAARAAEIPTIPAGATTQVPVPASNIVATCTPPGKFHPNGTTWHVNPSSVKVGGTVKEMPVAGSFLSVTVPADHSPYQTITISWSGTTECESYNGVITLKVGAAGKASACAAKKNFYGQDAIGRAWWAKVAEEARRRGRVAAEWGEFFDLFTWISKLPGLNDPDLKNALAVLNLGDAAVKELTAAAKRAEKKVTDATAELDQVKKAQGALSRQINQLTRKPGSKPLNAAQQGKLRQLKQQLRALPGKRRAAELALKEAKAVFSAANGRVKSKVMDPFIDALTASGKPALKALGHSLALLNFGQAGAAIGIVGFGALAAYANKASQPPKGC